MTVAGAEVLLAVLVTVSALAAGENPSRAPSQGARTTPGAARQGHATGRPGAEAPDLTWVSIPAGTFEMGCVPGDDECGPAEVPRHTVRISRAFELMATEVTLGMYRRLAPPPQQPEWSADDRQPIVNATWGEAASFCAAAGGRLPTEAEWEAAARGGRSGDRFVWGNAPVPLIDGRPAANVADSSGSRAYPHMTTFAGYDDGYSMTAPAGSFLPNAYGLFDMAGNAWEWVADWYDEGTYAVSPAADPRGPALGRLRVVRGGSWYSDPGSLRISRRGGDDPVQRPHGDGVGFRCARDVPR